MITSRNPRLDWTRRRMTALREIRTRLARTRPLDGKRISACLHVTAETGVLVQTLHAAGAQVHLAASNPLSTQDDIVDALSEIDGVQVFARRGVDRDTYYAHLNAALDHAPHLTIDDGADLVRLVHTDRRELLPHLLGGTEETTTGVVRLRSMAREQMLRYPIIAVNDADTKHRFDNRYGTGQSTLDGILRATNAMIAGSVFVVCGYGWCGRGVASRAAGLGARVIVTEIDPLRALEATLDGFHVMPFAQAAPLGDIFCTVTGNTAVIGAEHFPLMKDGALLCNAGHFDVEIDLEALASITTERRTVRPHLEAHRITPDTEIFVLGQGRLVNLAAAEGHPADVMDMSFAAQTLALIHLAEHRLEPGVHRLPKALDQEIAHIKLAGMGISIDTLTPGQETYLDAWQHGT